jgi:hypothetical protein
MKTLLAPQKPIEIFRAGKFTAMNGQSYDFSLDQVAELAASYNPDLADAPLVLGHPTTNAPRYGRAAKLALNDKGVLCAWVDQVTPEFAQWIEAKHFTKVSSSIFMPDAPGNPTPGKLYLRHVGLLGGVAPAVTGLAPVEFAADSTGVLEFAYADRLVVRLFRGLKNYLIESIGLDKANQIIDDYDLDYLAQDAVQADQDGAAFASPLPTQPPEDELTAAELAAERQKMAAQAAALEAREAQIAARERKAKLAGNAEFAAGLVTEGKLLPGESPVVLTLLARLDGVNDKVADFAAGDERVTQHGAELLKGLLAGLDKRVTYARVTPAGADGARARTADFAAPDGYGLDADGEAALQAIADYQRQHPGVSFIDAAKATQA